MNKQHKHAELIKAWADGAEIECHYKSLNKWYVVNDPAWSGDFEFRVKPKWTPEYTLIASEYLNDNPSYPDYNDISADVRNYWKLIKFVEEFETDWNNQRYEIFRGNDRNYNMDECGVSYPSLGAVRMSKQCAEKLCKMLNNGEIEL